MADRQPSRNHMPSGPTPLRPVESYSRPNGIAQRSPDQSPTVEPPRRALIRHPFAVGALSGVLGAALITLVALILQLAAGSELSFEILLGTLVTGRVDAGSWVLGFLWHLVNGAVFGLIYAAVFRSLARSGAALGFGIGVVHWIFGGVLFGIFSALNPFVPALIPPAGFFAASYGLGEALELLGLHLLFGAVVGAAYRASVIVVAPASRQEDRPGPGRQAA